MTKIDLGQTITILANLGVIAGIVFLAVQLQQVATQLEQDRSVAFADRLQANTDGARHWAEILVQNSDLWYRGISGDGESLSASEIAAFDALVEAWDSELWRRWFIGAYYPDISNPDIAPRWIMEAAHTLNDNAGLLIHWRRYHERVRRTSLDREWEELVEAELRRIMSQD